MGFESSSQNNQSSGVAQQWASNVQPSAYGANQFQNLMDIYRQQADEAYSPYTETGSQAMQQVAGLLGLEGSDPMSQRLSGLGGLISQGYNIPIPGHVRFGADSAVADVPYAGSSGEEFYDGVGAGIGADEAADGLNIPAPVTRTDFNVGVVGGRRRAQNEMERRTLVSNQLGDTLREAERGLGNLTNLTDPAERQTAFDAINEQLTSAAEAARNTQVEDPYWQKFLSEYANDISLYQTELQGDFQAELPAKQTLQQQLEQTPGYQFRFDQGMKAAQTSLAGRGLRGGGQQLKGLTEYGQGFASQEYDAALNRYMQAAGLGAQVTTQSVGNQSQLGSQGAQALLAGSGTIVRGPQTMHQQQQSSGSSKGFGVSL